MARGRAVGSGGGGGERIPAPRPTQGWLIQATVSVALAGGLSGWAALYARAGGAALAGLGAAATLAVAGSLVGGSVRVLAGAVAGVVGVVAVAIVARPSSAALVVGIVAYAMAELAFAAVQQGPVGARDPRADARHWQFTGQVIVVAATVGGVALLAADAVSGGGLGLEVAGMAGVAGLAGLVVALARRVPSSTAARAGAGAVSSAVGAQQVGSARAGQRRGRSVDEA